MICQMFFSTYQKDPIGYFLKRVINERLNLENVTFT